MAELEKLKQARQQFNKTTILKDTLKPRNVSLESYKIAYAKRIEDKIAQSRYNIYFLIKFPVFSILKKMFIT